MKKLNLIKIILLVAIMLLLVVKVFSADWYNYIGKKVEVHTISGYYKGTVAYVVGMDICKRYDNLIQSCVEKETKYTMFLKNEDGTITIIRCEAIRDIEEK
jgi:hypothetical protein